LVVLLAAFAAVTTLDGYSIIVARVSCLAEERNVILRVEGRYEEFP
jgi:hypothetical protein